MVKYENECVGCGQPCWGDACMYRHMPHYYCDECGDEAELTHYEGRDLCDDCLKEERG